MDSRFNNNPNNFGYGSPGMYNPMSTNIIRVTSLDEALMQPARRPSEMVYFNQDKDEFYNVKIDYDGRKTWSTFVYTLPNPDTSTPATKADINSIITRIENLEAKVRSDTNAKSDGQCTIYTFDGE